MRINFKACEDAELILPADVEKGEEGKADHKGRSSVIRKFQFSYTKVLALANILHILYVQLHLN